MKQLIYAAAAAMAALSGTAMAQSNVTVYGSIDAGLRKETNVDAAGNDVLTMGSNGTFRSNRLGFRGSEDLGSGLKANFVLEAGFNTATGALNNSNGVLFQREAHIGLSGKYGAVDLGRNYTIAYRTILAFDPFKYRYPSLTYALSSTAGTRKDNDIQYTGRFGDWTARAEYALGEVPGSDSKGTTRALGVKYASGPLKAGAVYTMAQQNAGTAAAPNYKDFDHYALGAAYTVDALTVSAGHVKSTQKTAALDNTSQWEWAGLSYQIGARLDITAAWYRTRAYNTRATASVAAGASRKDLYMAGITYELSKRTTLYSEIDLNKLEGGFAAGGSTRLNQTRQNGISAGIMHTF